MWPEKRMGLKDGHPTVAAPPAVAADGEGDGGEPSGVAPWLADEAGRGVDGADAIVVGEDVCCEEGVCCWLLPPPQLLEGLSGLKRPERQKGEDGL